MQWITSIIIKELVNYIGPMLVQAFKDEIKNYHIKEIEKHRKAIHDEIENVLVDYEQGRLNSLKMAQMISDIQEKL